MSSGHAPRYFLISLLCAFYWTVQAVPSDDDGPRRHMAISEIGASDFGHYAQIERSPSLKYMHSVAESCGDLNVLSLSAIDVKRQYICDISRSMVSTWDPVQIYQAHILFFGETHLDVQTQIEFSLLLKELSRQGYRTLAMEMFPSSTQVYLDQYLSDELSLDGVIAVLKKHWSYSSVGYREILSQAKLHGLRIIGLDDRVTGASSGFWEQFLLRDSAMAKVLAAELSNHDKIVVYTGALHSMKSFGKGASQLSLSQKLNLLLKEKSMNLSMQNFIFRMADKSVIYKFLTELHPEFAEQSLLARSKGGGVYADAVIYLYQDLTLRN